MEEKMAYIFGNYLVEFVKDNAQINGEVFYPGEKVPVGKVTCHFYNYNDHEDASHTKDDALHIDILRVQVEHDKKGIGTFLMKKVMEYVDKGKLKHVTTTPSPTGRISMEDLKKFYLKFRYGSGFLTKKIEFVDEDELLADVLEMDNDTLSGAVENVIGEEMSYARNKEQDSLALGKGASGTNDKLAKTTKANKVAYLTVVHFLDEELQSKNRILQIGASGAGVYGLYLAKKGHHVTVVEPDAFEVENLKTKVGEIPRLDIVNKPYEYIADIPSDSIDAVLCFGPMYSCLSLEEKEKIIKEGYRICKAGGTVFVSFMSNEMMVLEKTFNKDYDYLSGPKFDKVTGKVISSKKRILTFSEIEDLFHICRIKYTRRFAAEGVSMLIRDKMEGMSEKQFNTWMNYHYKTCEMKEFIGCSNHVVYVVKKAE